MPELPEVETIRRGLQKVIVGKKITKFESLDSKVIRFAEKDIIDSKIEAIERRAKILIFHLTRDVIPARAGIQKNTILDPRVPFDFAQGLSGIEDKPEDDKGIDSGKVILCHLKMTGQLIWEEKPGTNAFQLRKIKSPSTSFDFLRLRSGQIAQDKSLMTTQRVVGGHPSPDWVAKLPNAYTRAVFHFDDNSVLFFNDLRRFGYMKLYNTKEISSLTPSAGSNNKYSSSGSEKSDILNNIPELAKLGPEPIRFADAHSGQAKDEFNIDYLIRRAAKIPNRKIKQFITDQEIISGVGNIYVDEALFYAGVLPTRPVKDIQKSEWQKICDSIIKALELGLKYGGSSEDTYVDAFGNQGTMNEHCNVYRKTGQSCKVCGTKIQRITLGGRGTHFCPKCQR